MNTVTLYAVAYRTGGTANYSWHYAAATDDANTAEAQRRLMRASGRAAHVVSFTAGEPMPALPTTFEHAPFRRLAFTGVEVVDGVEVQALTLTDPRAQAFRDVQFENVAGHVTRLPFVVRVF